MLYHTICLLSTKRARCFLAPQNDADYNGFNVKVLKVERMFAIIAPRRRLAEPGLPKQWTSMHLDPDA
jgi:hypothetical protein